MKLMQRDMHTMKQEIAALHTKTGRLFEMIDLLLKLHLNVGTGVLDCLERRIFGLELQVSASRASEEASMTTGLVGDLHQPEYQ